MNIVEKIKLLQKEKDGKVSLNALEKQLEIGKSTISSWEKKQPSADKLEKIADYFNVSVDYLLGRTEERGFVSKHAASTIDGTEYDDLPEEAIEEMENYRAYLREKYRKK